MKINIRKELLKIGAPGEALYLNDVTLDPAKIKALMINEVVPQNRENDFYGKENGLYMDTTLALFKAAGVEVATIEEIIDLGIYLTNAAKTPKKEYAVAKENLAAYLPFLEKELTLFPNIKVIMLMGDVAKKAYNTIVEKEKGKNVIPPLSTYKARNSQWYNGEIRVFPSYIMTGKNILIEKSKFAMASEDIREMMTLIG